ncbi:hypothetical protein LEMLEM_LOCUS26200 [Lemmus lemmus]
MWHLLWLAEKAGSPIKSTPSSTPSSPAPTFHLFLLIPHMREKSMQRDYSHPTLNWIWNHLWTSGCVCEVFPRGLTDPSVQGTVQQAGSRRLN